MKRKPDKGGRFLYSVPDRFDTEEAFKKYAGIDLEAMCMSELLAERERVRFVLLFEPAPDAWFVKRLQAIEEAIREDH